MSAYIPILPTDAQARAARTQAAQPYRAFAVRAIERIAARVLRPPIAVTIISHAWEGQRVILTGPTRIRAEHGANTLSRELALIGWHVEQLLPRPAPADEPGWIVDIDVLGWSEHQVARRAELLRQALTGRLGSLAKTHRMAVYSAATSINQLPRPLTADDTSEIAQLTVQEISELVLCWPKRLAEVADLDRCSTVPALQMLLAQVGGLEQSVAARCRRHEEVAAQAATDLCRYLLDHGYGSGDSGRTMTLAVGAVLSLPDPDEAALAPVADDGPPVPSGMERLIAAAIVNHPADHPADHPAVEHAGPPIGHVVEEEASGPVGRSAGP